MSEIVNKRPLSLKLFGKHAVVYGIGIISTRAVSFLLIPLYTHSLSLKDFGLLATLFITIEILFISMHMGLRTSILRFSKDYESIGLIGHMMTTSVLMNVLGGFIITGTSVMFLEPFFNAILHTEHVRGYIVLANLAALSNSLFVLMITYYRAKNDPINYMLYYFTAAVLLVVLNIVFLRVLDAGVKGVLLAQIASYFTLFIIASYKVFLKIGVGISMPVAGKLMHFGFPLIFAMSSSLVMDTSSYYFLSYFKQLEDVAIYSLGCKLASIVSIVLISSFQIAYEPFVFNNRNVLGIREAISRLLTYLMFIFTIVSFAVVIFSHELLPLIAPPQYSSAYLIIVLILPAYAFRGVYYVGEALLNVAEKTRLIGAIAVTFALIGVLLNFVLIPKFGMYGALIIANLISISRSLFIMGIGLKLYPVQIEVRRLGIIFVMFFSYLSLFIFMNDAPRLIFYGANLSILSASALILYLTGFFNSHEKHVIKRVLFEVRSRMAQ